MFGGKLLSVTLVLKFLMELTTPIRIDIPITKDTLKLAVENYVRNRVRSAPIEETIQISRMVDDVFGRSFRLPNSEFVRNSMPSSATNMVIMPSKVKEWFLE